MTTTKPPRRVLATIRELVQASLSTKDLVASRILLSDMHQPQQGPSQIALEASAVILGAKVERVPHPMHYMAIRYGTGIKLGETVL